MSSLQVSSNSLVITMNGLIIKHESFENLKSTLTTLSNNEHHGRMRAWFHEPMGILPVTVEQIFEKDLLSLLL